MENKEIMALQEQGYKVERFTDFHYRINEKLDIHPTTHKFCFLPTQERGSYIKLNDVIEKYFYQPRPKAISNSVLELRYELAAKAMQGLVGTWVTIDSMSDKPIGVETCVRLSYAIADEMLKQKASHDKVAAAANDLLESLTDAVEWFKKLDDWSGVGDPNLDMYLKAIKKATE